MNTRFIKPLFHESNRCNITLLAALAATAGAFILTGCNSTKQSTTLVTKPTDVFPVTIKADNGSVAIPTKPQHIISLSPTATEMLYAVGAGSQVIAVDDQSTYPAQAPKTSLSGYNPNAEAVAKYNPDLVIIQNDSNGLLGSLARLQIPVLVEGPAKTFDDAYAQVRSLGLATGHAVAGNKTAGDMKLDIDDTIAKTPPLPTALRAYHEGHNILYSSTSSSLIGQIYSRLGLVNIADAGDSTGSPFPQLPNEYVVKSDPDIIFLADTKCCGQSEQTVAQRPGWNSISAVKTGNIVPLDDDVASRWGPRLVDLVHNIADAVNRAAATVKPAV